MMSASNKYKFEFSLVVLNQLGRGLYRNFSTVVAEAVSNSWDAGATEVRIEINSTTKCMIIRDNGIGMDDFDFQNKFLKVGYSKRDAPDRSQRKRLGRKGIGKLAFLTVSEKITIKSKKEKSEEIGAIIDNRKLDQAIKDHDFYELDNLFDGNEFNNNETGTIIKFEKIIPKFNRDKLVRKYLAILFNFNFSFAREKFKIYVNEKLVNENDLEELNKNTEFLWLIGLDRTNTNKLINRFSNSKVKFSIDDKNICQFTHKDRIFHIRGFIASVVMPSQIKIKGSFDDKDINGFKASVHLFSNGRSRQDDVFRDIPSERFVESYLFGEIHVDEFDDGEDDIFTSSRDGLSIESYEYDLFLGKMKNILERIIREWGKERKTIREKIVDNRLNEILKGGSNLIREDKKKSIANLSQFIDDHKSKKFVDAIEALHPILVKLKNEGAGEFKKILIVHSGSDKCKSSLVYLILLKLGFLPSEILYTSSEDEESDIPGGRNIFAYIREFFIQDIIMNPFIIFVYSKNLKNCWNAILEVGATWVTGASHCVFTIDGETPAAPLNMDQHLFGKTEELNSYTSWKIFKIICNRYQIDICSYDQFKHIVIKVLKSSKLDKSNQQENIH